MNTTINSPQSFFGHTFPGDHDTSRWELLADHLEKVSHLAERFAAEFRSAEWGRLAGLWHDLGKYSLAFQNYLLSASGVEAHIEQSSRVDHATGGAQHAEKTIPNLGRLLAYVIAGHHAGLANASGELSSIEERLRKVIEPIPAVPMAILNQGESLQMPALNFDEQRVWFQVAFFTRMLFSCLVDADFLATEQFMSPGQSALRPSTLSPLPTMKSLLDRFLESKSTTAHAGTVTDCRRDVLNACRNAAELAPGLFSLTVPTGGGKTLSSLTFAVDHAIKHGKSRVIYAIPFTSIIEQTAGVFREVFQSLGSEVVLEHHSNIDPDSDHETPKSRLAAENWDASLIVTTNVQLFESLFAARTPRCRKLHNLVNSVIILDEAQTLPVDRLRPCLATLEELVRNYGCTVVLCTATQPAVQHQDDFEIGLRDVREIISEPEHLYRKMKRVTVTHLGRLTDDELVDRLVEHDAFLTIANTRSHAAKLYRDLIGRLDHDDGVFHLSTLMCGEHRAKVIAEIRHRLVARKRCRVISTQLIEAGVDVDFPVVYRAMTGIDSIAQAAGRCNREGLLDSATVYVFDPADLQLIGYLGSVAQSARELAPDFPDLLDPAAVHAYFKLHYWKQAGCNRWDKTKAQSVMECFPARSKDHNMPFNFRTAAERFRMIEENGQTLFVPYGRKGAQLIEQLRGDGPGRLLLRKLQRYTVTLHDGLFRQMQVDIEHIEKPHGQYPVLINPSGYDEKLGLRIDRPGYIEPAMLIG